MSSLVDFLVDHPTAKKDMTWGEFKSYVEAQGVTDDSFINYIDMWPENGVPVEWEDLPGDKRHFFILSSDD